MAMRFARRSYSISTLTKFEDPYKLGTARCVCCLLFCLSSLKNRLLSAKHLEAKFFINGKFEASKETFPVNSPATGELVASAARGEAAAVDSAVNAAHSAFKTWAAMPSRQRGALIAKCGDLLREHSEEIAKLTALETGKALRTESAVEAGVLADSFTFYGGLGGEIKVRMYFAQMKERERSTLISLSLLRE